MDKAIEYFFSVYSEEFDRNSKIEEDTRYIEAVNSNEDVLKRTINALAETYGKELSSELIEEVENTFYSLMRIKNEHIFKHAFNLGVIVGMDVQKEKGEHPLIQ